MLISRSHIVASVAVIYTLCEVVGHQRFFHAVWGMLPLLTDWLHWLIRNRHEIVGTAVKVGSKVEKGIK